MRRFIKWGRGRCWGILAGAVGLSLLLTLTGVNVVTQTLTGSLSGISLGEDKVITLGHVAYAAGAVDYTFDGVDDNVQFQAALDALPATGGRLVVVSAVQINFSATVTRAIDNVVIEGAGRGTYFVNDGGTALFTAGGDNWVFRDFRTDAGGIDVGSTTGWLWDNITVDSTFYAARTPVETTTGSSWEIPTGRAATYVVAASDAPSHVKAQADYVCDGTDDQTEILAAISAADADGGGVVELTTGTFNISAYVYITGIDNVWLRGQGVGTHVIASGELGPVGVISIHTPTTNFTLSDMWVDANGTNGHYAVSIRGDDASPPGTEHIRVFNVVGEDAEDDAFEVVLSASDVRISHSSAIGTITGSGFEVGDGANNVWIEQNLVDADAAAGLAANSHPAPLLVPYDIHFVNNYLKFNTYTNPSGVGISIAGSQGVRDIWVEGNSIVLPAESGIKVQFSAPTANVERVHLNSNKVYGRSSNGSANGIYVRYTDVAEIVNNEVYDFGGIGYYFRDSTYLTVTGNMAVDNENIDYEFQNVDHFLFDGNTGYGVGAAPSYGGVDFAGTVTEGIVSNNRLANSLYGFRIFNGNTLTTTIVEGNNFDGNVSGAWYQHSGATLTDVKIFGNQGYIAPGEVRSVSRAITAGAQNTVTSIQNTFGGDVLIVEAYVMISTAASATNPTYDMGTDDDGVGAPSVGNNLFDAIPDTVGYYRSTSNGLGGHASGLQTQPIIWQAVGNDWVNFIISDADGLDTAGTIYVTVIGK